MKKTFTLLISLFMSMILTNGCITKTTKTKYPYQGPRYEKDIQNAILREFPLTPGSEEKILALDPEHVTEKEIKEVLSGTPAPRIVNIHGGIYPVYMFMTYFSEFLISMGYPEESIINPVDGTYSYSCYMNSEELAGMIAWFYEREGMKPMVVGHSQGGMQAVKLLHELAGSFSKELPVWNPLTGNSERRTSIIDPFTGEIRPVVGVKLSYVTAVGAGGFTRFLINQWSMIGKLRSIPDSVDEFTGFYMGLDIAGGDLLGFGSINRFRANEHAKVRNVKLPLGYNHLTVPDTRHLAQSREIRDWINSYTPTEEPELTVTFESPSEHILWAADVWHSIKRHWVLELQKLIRAKQKLEGDN